MVQGDEELAPPIDQKGMAFFGLEELVFGRFKIQIGARLETQRYNPAYAVRGEDQHDDEEGGHHGEIDEEGDEERSHPVR